MSASAVSSQRLPSKPISRYVINTTISIYSAPACMPLSPSLDVHRGINLPVTSASLDAVVRSLFTSVFSYVIESTGGSLINHCNRDCSQTAKHLFQRVSHFNRTTPPLTRQNLRKTGSSPTVPTLSARTNDFQTPLRKCAFFDNHLWRPCWSAVQ